MFISFPAIVAAAVSDDDSQDKDSNESEDFANLPCFGLWADREDMRDSVAWVRKQRENNRIGVQQEVHD